ncbi:hypothetical protein BVI2075_210005 [Burkholderia vietnamiensis]|nr:hypothetical protein BVI2075_210005 [Burkholderia vietnamiensis]CAG9234719.1 hypothetical protein BVI1335_980011 [Burkholderia vietnamiensis]
MASTAAQRGRGAGVDGCRPGCDAIDSARRDVMTCPLLSVASGSAGVSFARALVSMAVDRCALWCFADVGGLSHETRDARKSGGRVAGSRGAGAVVSASRRRNRNDYCNMRNTRTAA